MHFLAQGDVKGQCLWVLLRDMLYAFRLQEWRNLRALEHFFWAVNAVQKEKQCL